MSTIGTLAVNVIANTGQLASGLSGARGELRIFEGAVNAVGKSVKATFVGLGTTMAASLTVRSLSETISQIDDMADAAERLGTTAGKLGGLKHAGILSDVDNETLIKALTVMEQKVGSNSDAFADLGLNVDQLKKLDAVEMFIQIADAINKLPTPAERTAAAMATIGKGGADMMQLISGGRAGIERAASEAERMGLAPSAEEIARIAEADKATKQLAESWRGLTMMLAVETSPTIKKIAEMLTGMMGGDTPAQKAWDDTIGLMTDSNFDAMRKAMQGVDGQAQQGNWSDRRHLRELNKVTQQYLGDDFHADDVYEARAIQRRGAKRDELARQQAQFAKGAPWRAGESALASLTSGFSFKDAAKGFMGSLNASAPAFAARSGSGALFDFLFRSDPGGEHADWWDPSAQLVSGLGNLDIAGNVPNQLSARRGLGVAPGFSALEYGTAAGFSQERRSALASQEMDVAKQTLTENKKQTAQLAKIDTSIKNTQKLEVLTIA